MRAVVGAATLCGEPGTDGQRVQAIYAHPSSIASRLSAFRANFIQYAANVDLAFSGSAAETGGQRHVRFLTDASCNLLIDDVTVTNAAFVDQDTSPTSAFNAMIDQLASKGYNRTDRKYLIWYDAADAMCGIGTQRADDSADLTNANNTTTGYARVDGDCWDYAEPHELMHTLGGVQNSAPHSSRRQGGSGHCTDDYDVMCYADATTVKVQTVCTNVVDETLYDCNHDDYFNTAPLPSSYLATHWNTANSSWLDPAPVPWCGAASGTRNAITVPIRDRQGGLLAITPVPNNMTVTPPVFVPGTTTTVTYSAKKIDRTKKARLALTITDTDGNVRTCAYRLS